MKRLFFTAVAMAFLFTPSLMARIINIPADYQTIQAGINASVNGDTVLVQPGTYVENLTLDTLNIVLASLLLTTGDTSYIARTIIDGDSANTVITLRSCNNTTIIQGFTIRNGLYNRGGGINCSYSSPSILNNYIINNFANWDGAGIYSYYSSPHIMHNTISGNKTLASPGYNGFGAGIMCETSNATISENKILQNIGNVGAGICCERFSFATISNNVIRENIADNHGGGIYCYWVDHTGPIISENSIYGNRAAYGGGISCATVNPVIEDNFIENNESNLGGGVFLSTYVNGTFKGNLIRNNRAIQNGGGLIISNYSNPTIHNNIITENSAGTYGAVCNYGSINITTPLYNNVIWNNSTPQSITNLVINYTVIQGGYPGIGNINSDPLFINPSIGDYNVCESSPCIDNGDPQLLDPDNTRSDIGIYYPQHPECTFGNSWFVSTSGNDTTGLGSEKFPFRMIQHAINVSKNTDKVIVEGGCYVENINLNSKNIQLLSKHLLDDSGQDLAPATIDGDSAGSCLTISGCDSTTIIQGFVFQHGRAMNGGGINISNSAAKIEDCTFKNNYADSNGGAIYCRNSSPLINNCKILNNYANNKGGGLFCFTSNPTIDNNTIELNNARLDGGGVSIAGNSSSPTLRSNIIRMNQSGRNGGGVNSEYHNNPTISKNLISTNSAVYGGGISVSSSNRLIDDNDISNNFASNAGGGVYANGTTFMNNRIDGNASSTIAGGAFLTGSIFTYNIVCRNTSVDAGGVYSGAGTILGNKIYENNATNRGGGFYINGTSNRFSGNVIINNHSSNKGGGICCWNDYSTGSMYLSADSIGGNFADSLGGGIYLYKTNIELNRAVFSHNDSRFGGGIYSNKSGNNVYYSRIFSNTSLSGGALYAKRSSLLMSNSTISDNTADSVGGGFYFSDTSNTLIKNSIFWGDSSAPTPEIYQDPSSSVVMNYCNIQDGWPGIGNINIDPMFRNPAQGDFHLMAIACGDSVDSPCIDAGASYLSDTIMSCDWGLGTTRSDMGAYGGGIGQIDIDDNETILPERTSLSQNYPNPFNSNTVISFELPAPSLVRIDIFDILGRKVQTLLNEYKPADHHQITWQSGNSSSGIYFYSIKTEKYSEIKKMLLIK